MPGQKRPLIKPIPATDLTLDPESHTYSAGGRVIPSATQVISTVQLWRGMSAEVLEHARVRGSKVDDAVNLYDEGLDGAGIDAIDDEIVPYLLAWKLFKRDAGCIVLASQVRGFNQMYGYAGTLDKIVSLEGPVVIQKAVQKIALLDIKATAKIEPEAALQTAAYENMDGIKGKFGPIKRFTLQLKPDATYRLHEWKDRADFPTFLAALTLVNWRKQS